MRNKLGFALTLLPLCAGFAQAHVSLTEKTAKAGGELLAALRVGHGCNGSPTISLTVSLPPGVTARPQAKTDWSIEQKHEAGKPATIGWRGGSLAADQFDDFPILLHLPATPGILAFPVNQVCAAGSENWSELPAPGKSLSHPAPLLTVVKDTAPSDDMHGMVMP